MDAAGDGVNASCAAIVVGMAASRGEGHAEHLGLPSPFRTSGGAAFSVPERSAGWRNEPIWVWKERWPCEVR